MRKFLFAASLLAGIFAISKASAQVPVDTIPSPPDTLSVTQPTDTLPGGERFEDYFRKYFDTTLRITNLNPYFTLHVDSSLSYKLEINKDPEQYYWFLRNSPVGLRINKDNGLLTFKAEKSYFLSGRLKYDSLYQVNVGVQSLINPKDRVDTTFSITFFSTEIIPSRVKPSVANGLVVDEGDPITFQVQCEEGSFPIESILFYASATIQHYQTVTKCGDVFSWTPDYDFTKATDKDHQREIILSFVGSTRFNVKDTAKVRITVRDALNYPMAVEEHRQVVKNIQGYTLRLKYAFLLLDKKLKKTKSTRTTFDLTGASTALSGTILNTAGGPNEQKFGKVLPSVGVALVPIKEASAPNKNVEQNQASLIRSSIKRLEYMVGDNMLVGDKDPDIQKKTAKLKEELKQVQIQLIEVPIEETNNMSEEQLNRYFNNPKVNKKYRLKG